MGGAWSYPPPLDRLFTFGEAEWGTRKEMPNYVADLGLMQQHVPVLVEIVRSVGRRGQLAKRPRRFGPDPCVACVGPTSGG